MASAIIELDRFTPVATPQNSNINPVTIASAASLANAITYFATFISGTAAMTGFRLPRGYRGIFLVIPTAAFSGATGGTLAYATDTEDIPIGRAFTAVANQPILFFTNGLLCYPLSVTV